MDERIYKINIEEAIKYDPLVKSAKKIKKGERIIQVKGTAKVKSHKRRIKIGKEKITKRIVSTDYKESVQNVNDYISKLNKTDEGKEIVEAMKEYTIDTFISINEYMKHGESEIFKETLPQGKIRGQKKYTTKDIKDSISNIKKFINDAPKFEGKVYRGSQYRTDDLESKQRWDAFIKNIEGSKEMKFGSFLSTSTEKIVGVNFATLHHGEKNLKSCLITIKTKSGVSIENISLVRSEHEVLIDSDKTYKIIKFEKQDDRNHFLELEEI